MTPVPESAAQTTELFFKQMFVGPLWPASILVCLMVAYTLLVMIGLIDFGVDAPEIDLDPSIDLDVDVDAPLIDTPDLDATVDVPDADVVPVDSDFLQGLGAATIRWSNFGRVPVVIWGGVFAVSYWTVTYLLWHGFDSNRYEPTLLPSLLLTIRNLVIGVAVTKMLTQPMVKHFVAPPSYTQHRIIGATCEVCTTEATPDFGQAKFRTNAAPLLLNVRTDGPHISKGQEVQIIGFHDKDKRIYKVAPLSSENQS
jgi:hypothetical protein